VDLPVPIAQIKRRSSADVANCRTDDVTEAVPESAGAGL